MDNFPFAINIPFSDYSVFSDDFSVEVPVSPLLNAKAIWTNDAWLIEKKGSGCSLEDLKQVKRWMTATMGVRTCIDTGIFPTIAFRADRYGSPNGTAHGGSGRCGFKGRFNVKGIGPTPLVSPEALDHCDGILKINDAIRSAIFSELVHHQSMHGAVRMVGILSPNKTLQISSESPCLLVRENFIRPAHAERSLFFGTSGFEGSDQFIDNRRSSNVRDYFANNSITWEDISCKCAEQIGSLDFLRMANGLFTSSNFSILGQVGDFDDFKCFDDWDYLSNPKKGINRFGRELEDLINCAIHWSWILGNERAHRDYVKKAANISYREGFYDTASSLAPKAFRSDTVFHKFLEDFLFLSSCNKSNTFNGLILNAEEPDEYLRNCTTWLDSFGIRPEFSTIITGRLLYWSRKYNIISDNSIENFLSDANYRNRDISVDLPNFIRRSIVSSFRIHHGIDDDIIPLFPTPTGTQIVIVSLVRKSFFLGKLSRQNIEIEYRLSPSRALRLANCCSSPSMSLFNTKLVRAYISRLESHTVE